MIRSMETTDFGELSAAQEGWDVIHKPLEPREFRGRMEIATTGSIEVDLERWGSALELVGAAPPGCFSLALALDDASTFLTSGLEVGLGQAATFGPGVDVYAVIPPRTTLLSVSIELHAVEDRADPASQVILKAAKGHRVLSTDRARRAGCVATARTCSDCVAARRSPSTPTIASSTKR